MISKELLSEVLNKNILSYEFDMYGNIDYKVINDYGSNINIYELAHKCKEWALEKNLTLFSGNINNQDNNYESEWSYDCQIFSHKEGIELFYIKSLTEPDAIFKACQWILDSKED